MIHKQKFHSKIWETRLKRIFDIWVSMFLIVLFSPLMLVITVITVAVFKTNPFFVQKRMGMCQKTFKIIKFRTMFDTSEGIDTQELRQYKIPHWGRILRDFGWDELPQLFQVMVGQMSLVGPRPLPVQYLSSIPEVYKIRFKVRPGITGLVQILGRNALTWHQKFELDKQYVNNISFLHDMQILYKTCKYILGPKNGEPGIPLRGPTI